MNLMCTRCKQRMAIIFVSHMEDDKPINDGYCLKCARELGIPQVQEMLDKLGVSEDDIDTLSGQMMEMMGGEENFEPGGARAFPAFLQNFMTGNLPIVPETEAESGEEQANTPPMIPLSRETESVHGKTTGVRQKGVPERHKRKFLDGYCENLTHKAAEGRIDNIIGRDREIYRVMQILNRRQKNNPCLIGEPGVGKTAIAEGIAQRLVSGDVPPRLADKELYLLDLTALVAGTQFRGQFESRVKGLVADVKDAGNVILFIDEVHNLIGAGDAEGSMNAANILKPALSRGEIQVIGATTFTEYRKHIEKDAALERRFQPVTVNEPSMEDTVQVLMGIKKYYEQFHRVTVSEEVVRRAVSMSERYITDRYLPDKAIDLLDEACSCSTLDNKALAQYEKFNRSRAEKEKNLSDLETSADEQVYQSIAELKADIARVNQKMIELEPEALGCAVTLDDLARVVELWTGIPASKIREGELQKVAMLAKTLKKHIIGQDVAVEMVAAAVRRTRIQLSSRRRPASFIFVGPTGVGKTELVRRLAQEMFDAADPLIRLDMSEFMEKHSVSRLVGSPPGYIGYDEAGQLTEKVRRKPYSVVLFDEIEKAHPDVLNVLLQILDEGHVTDAHGRMVSFENTIIVMTSNAGSNIRGNAVGFDKTEAELSRERMRQALSDFLRPEFLARVDEIVVFRALNVEDFGRIAALMLEELKEPLLERGVHFGWNEDALSLIAHTAFGKKSGARDIRQVIRREVEDPLTLILVEHPDTPPALVHVTAQEGKVSLTLG